MNTRTDKCTLCAHKCVVAFHPLNDANRVCEYCTNVWQDQKLEPGVCSFCTQSAQVRITLTGSVCEACCGKAKDAILLHVMRARVLKGATCEDAQEMFGFGAHRRPS